ncbi:MAG: fibronectin type III domain-containing protein [Patescibacteria group bacterium]
MEKEGNDFTIDAKSKGKIILEKSLSFLSSPFRNKKTIKPLFASLFTLFVLIAAAVIIRQNLIGADAVPYQPGPKVWTGEGPTNNWSDDLNWRDINTNLQTGVPAAGDSVTFNGAAVNGSKNSVLDTPITISGLTITTGYTGTVSGTANNFTTTTFFQSGGIFAAPSGILTIADTMNRTGGTFNHNNGTVKFIAKAADTDEYNITTGNATFNNVIFDNNANCASLYYCAVKLMDNFSVVGNLTVQNTVSGTPFDVVGNTLQTVTVAGNFSISSGTGSVDVGGTVQRGGDEYGGGCEPGAHECPIQGNTPTIDFYIAGNITIGATGGSGTSTIHGNVTFNGAGGQIIALNADGVISAGNTWTNNNIQGVVKQGSAVSYGGSLTLATGSVYFTDGGSCSQFAGYGLGVAGSYSNNGTLRVRGDENLSFTQDSDSGTTEFVGCDNNLKYNYLIKDFTDSGYDYNNLTFNSADDAPDQFVLKRTLTVRGDFTLNKGNFITYDVPSNNYPISIGGGLINHGGTFYFKGTESITYGFFDSIGGTFAYTNRGASEIIPIRNFGGTGYYNLTLMNAWGCYNLPATPVLYSVIGPLVVHNDFNVFGGMLWNNSNYPITVDGKTTVGWYSYCDSSAPNPTYNPNPEFYSPSPDGSPIPIVLNGGLDLIGGRFTASRGNLDINANLHIFSNGIFENAPSIMTISGDFIKEGAFNSGTTGSVTMDGGGGTTQTLRGNINFNNFIAGATAARTLSFTEGYTYFFMKRFEINGSAGQLITLKAPGNATWTINPDVTISTPQVSYADISFSSNIGKSFCATYSIDSGNNQNWNINESYSCSVPDKPSNVAITNIDSTRFDVAWTDNSDNETGFQVFTAPAADNCADAVYSDPPLITPANATSQNIIDKQVNTRYCAKVVAFNSVPNDTIYYSNPAFSAPKYTLANRPNAPTLTQVVPGTTNVKVDQNNNPATTQYAVFVTDGGLFNKYIDPSGTFLDSIGWFTYDQLGGDAGLNRSGFLVNKNYTWRVIARNGDLVETAWSPDASAYTLANIPNAPTLQRDTSSSIKIIINGNGNPSYTEYAISCDNDATFINYSTNACEAIGNGVDFWRTYAAWGGAGGFIDTGLGVNTLHIYKVKARNGDNIETILSPPASRYTLANIPGLTVDGDYDTTNGYHVDATVLNNLNPPGTTRYIEYSLLETGPYLSPAGMSWQSDPAYIFSKDSANADLLPNTQYWLRIKARNVDGNETGYSDPVATVTPPAAPANPAVSNACQNSALLSWTASAGADSYNISYGTDAEASNLGLITNIADASYTFSNLELGTAYNWKVSATNTNGDGAYSAISQIITETCNVTAPVDFAGTALSTTSINWYWSDNSTNEEAYSVRSSVGINLSGSLPPDTAIWAENSLSVNTAYTRYVNVVNPYSNQNSNQDTVFTLAETPDAPTLVPAGSTGIGIIINRNGNPLAETRYAIFNETLNQYLKTDGGLQATEDWQLYADFGGLNGVINTGLTPNVAYTYRVKAENGDFIPTELSPPASTTTLESFTVTVNVVGDGTVDQASQTVNYGSSLTANASAAVTSNFVNWTGCDTATTTVCDLVNIRANKTITATFSLKTYTVTATAAGGGSINPSGLTTYNYGESGLYTITADAAYILSEIMVDGAPINTTDSYTFQNIVANHTISASFATIPAPTEGDLTITLPDPDFAYRLFDDQRVTWEQTAGTNRDNTDHYRLSYSIGSGQLTTLADNISRDAREQSFNLNTSVCPLNPVFRIQIDALNSAGTVVDADYIVGTISLSGLNLQIQGDGNPDVINGENHYIIAISPSESVDLSGRLLTENQTDISGSAQLNWKINGGAGAINSNGHFTAGTTLGLYVNAVQLTASLCGLTINSYVTVRIRDEFPVINDVATPVEKAIEKIGIPVDIVSPVVTTGSAVAVGALLFAAPLANLASLYSISEFLRSIWYALLALFGYRTKKKWGRVIEEESKIPIPMAKVTLIRLDWDPLTKSTDKKEYISTYTDKKGYYGLIAQPGKYTIQVAKRGYTVSGNLVNGYVPGSVVNVHNNNESLVVPDIGMTMAEKSLASKAVLIRTIEELERSFRVVAVVLLAIGSLLIIKDFQDYPGAVSIIMMVVYAILWIINIYNWLDRSPWGMIIDKGNNDPVPLALIRIYDGEDDNLIRTTVSNMGGRFSAFVPKGSYKIIATKTGYREVGPINFTSKKELINIDNKILMEKIS